MPRIMTQLHQHVQGYVPDLRVFSLYAPFFFSFFLVFFFFFFFFFSFSSRAPSTICASRTTMTGALALTPSLRALAELAARLGDAISGMAPSDYLERQLFLPYRSRNPTRRYYSGYRCFAALCRAHTANDSNPRPRSRLNKDC